MAAKKNHFLHRYASLPALIYLLQEKKITLLSPFTWEDRNDAYFMRQYKERKSLKTLLALCFADCPETFHHWKVFTAGSEGICVDFHKDELLQNFSSFSRIEARSVKYHLISYFKKKKPKLDDLPFLKRNPYRSEEEFRIVYTHKKLDLGYKDFAVDLDCIDCVRLSPWMPKAVVEAVKATIKSIDGCKRLRVFRSTLLENETWKEFAEHN